MLWDMLVVRLEKALLAYHEPSSLQISYVLQDGEDRKDVLTLKACTFDMDGRS